MYPTGNHAVGIVSGKEDYDILKVSCKELFGEINELIEKGEIEVNGNKIPLEFYLSGDYKVTIMMMIITIIIDHKITIVNFYVHLCYTSYSLQSNEL